MASVEVPQFVEWQPSGAIEQVDSQTVLLTDLSDRFDDPLKLLERPARLDIYQDFDSRIYSLSLPSCLLLGEDLIKLMSAARPDFLWFEDYGTYRTTERVEYGGNRIGTLADWGFAALPVDVKRRLFLEHKAVFGRFWDEFYEFHADKFSQAVGTWSKGEYEGFFKYEMGYVADKEYVVENLGKVLRSVDCHLHNRDHPAEFLRDKFDELKDDIGEVDRKYLDTFSFFCEYAEFVTRLSRKAKERLVDLGVLKDTKFLLDLNSEPSEKAVWPKYNPTEVSSLVYLGDGAAVIKSGESFVRFKVEGVEQREVSRQIVVEEDKMMIPAIIWARKASGERFYLSGELPGVLRHTDPREDSLLGLLLVTYLYEDVRKSLGEEWSFAGSQLQRMMEAQLPLLDSVFRDKIMQKAPIFDKLEQISEFSIRGVA